MANDNNADNAADVINGDGWCTIFLPTEVAPPDGGEVTGDLHAVVNADGTVMFTCKSELEDWMAPPEKAIRLDNKNTNTVCTGAGDIADSWFKVITPSGKVTLVCHFPKGTESNPNCPDGQKECDGSCIPSDACCTPDDCPIMIGPCVDSMTCDDGVCNPQFKMNGASCNVGGTDGVCCEGECLTDALCAI